MLTKGVGQRRLTQRAPRFRKSNAAFEKLPVFVHQANQGDGRCKNFARDPRQAIKNLLRRGIKQSSLP